VTFRWLVPLGFAVLLAGCAAGADVVSESEAEAGPASATDQPPPAPSTVTTAAPPPTTTTAAPPAFVSLVRAVTEAELGSSWKPGCPLPVEDLRWIEVTHWDNEGNAVEGVLVVRVDQADDVVTVFERLFEAGFPIQSMRPIEEFGGDDDASMAANNSSGFNCREIPGRPGEWSRHAFGGAIDINPLVNPWVRGSLVDPPGGEPYVDRTLEVPGLIVADSVVTRAFHDIGWFWGGDWSSTLDYQHFSANGR
jgi:D-alanyl-D-alanine carboxypeptidase-like protein